MSFFAPPINFELHMTFLSATAPAALTPDGLTLPLTGGFTLRIDFLADWLARVAIVPGEGFAPTHRLRIAPAIPHDGRI